MEETIWTTQLKISLAISVIMAITFIMWQIREYRKNAEAIANLKRFFCKSEAYSTYESCDYDGDGNSVAKSVKIKEVAKEDAELRNLIDDINAYIMKSKGTVAFSIIQNKTERRITMLYEIATSKLSFPTHIGLMGTFAGVFVGLSAFLIGTWTSGEITDSNIQSLISGVLVSMLTSCVGIWLLIRSHNEASEATNQIDRDKNDFYEWVQNELMPSVDVSMVEAIGKLHETIDNFEPTFSRVISQFKDAFKDVTGAFGTDFRQSVKVVADAVRTMGRNMDKVNTNIELQDKLLETMKSSQLAKGMNAFVEASQRFSEITGSLDQFERARRIMLVAAQETINIQKDFNESLQIPKQVAADINVILNRVTKFEKNIEGLGVNIAHTQMVGNALVEQIKENISAINGKQKVAENYASTANKRLEAYFEEQKKEVSRIAQKYNEALEAYLSDYEAMLKERKQQLEMQSREFAEAIDRKLSLDEIRSDFAALRKIDGIYRMLEQIAANKADYGRSSGTSWMGHNHSDAQRTAEERNRYLMENQWQKEHGDAEQDIRNRIYADNERERKAAEAIARYTDSAPSSATTGTVNESKAESPSAGPKLYDENKKTHWYSKWFKKGK